MNGHAHPHDTPRPPLYQPYHYPPQPQPPTGHVGMGTVALILGVIGVFCALTAPFAMIIGGIVLGNTRRGQPDAGRGPALAGLMLGVFVILAWMLVLLIAGVSSEFAS